ncbi:MAG: hypothetical protein J5I47_08405 [Vicingus serpentipes]|nr:hypothetical protein [Vicingus serpentipes]
MKKILLTLFICLSLLLFSCSKKDPIETPSTTTGGGAPNEPSIVFKIKFDSTLARLDNFGNPATIPAGNSAQSPVMHQMSAHYIELAADSHTQIGQGAILYHGDETTVGGTNAVDFDKAVIVGQNGTICTVPISNVTPGTYKWIRVSLTYQNYDIDFIAKTNGNQYTGRLASFVGFNNYITNYTIKTATIPIFNNKLQGFWGFETTIPGAPSNPYVYEGQAPGTTVPNPISSTSPVPAGSCVVTGGFPTPLTITGTETQNITVYINLSTNKSFEWRDLNGDGFFEPTDGVNAGDTVVDMGLRGLFPTYIK